VPASEEALSYNKLIISDEKDISALPQKESQQAWIP
jgi:hypothetical protein